MYVFTQVMKIFCVFVFVLIQVVKIFIVHTCISADYEDHLCNVHSGYEDILWMFSYRL